MLWFIFTDKHGGLECPKKARAFYTKKCFVSKGIAQKLAFLMVFDASSSNSIEFSAYKIEQNL